MNPGIIGFPLPPSAQIVEQFFDVPGTFPWSKPRGLVALYYEIVGGGAGGSSGEIGATTANRRGAGSGGGGQCIRGYLLGSLIPDSGLVIVGSGSAGAAGNSIMSLDGNASSFCGVLFAAGGGSSVQTAAGFFGEGRGLTFSGDGPGHINGTEAYGRSGVSGVANGNGNSAATSGLHAGGGGGGGGRQTGTATATGGAGGRGFARSKLAPTSFQFTSSGPAGATATTAAQSGSYGSGDGGGGGAYVTGANSQGADGAWPGGGGGGGGGADTGFTTAGGNGAGGMVRLWLWVPT